MTKIKLSFKKEKPETGLASIGNPYPATQVKIDKKVVGMIYPPTWRSKDNLWHVRFSVKNNDNFHWITLKKRFDSEPEAREFIKTHIEAIVATYTLHPQDYDD